MAYHRKDVVTMVCSFGCNKESLKKKKIGQELPEVEVRDVL